MFNSSGLRPFQTPTDDNNTPYRMSNTNDWKYEMRRESQEMIPKLYLGPFQASTNLAKMQSLGITHVLCIRDRREASMVFPRFPDHFVYMTLEISDSIDQNLITVFPQCKDFIENALNAGGTVLAHCNGGISLSPAIVIGYLMYKCGWRYEYALTYVQSKRYCVSPSSFTNQLNEYEPIILAQRAIAQANPNWTQPSVAQGWVGNKNKRGLATEHQQASNESDEVDFERKYQIPPQPWGQSAEAGGSGSGGADMDMS